MLPEREKTMGLPNSPCAGCKFLRRKCTHECVFAPYFPPDQPQKFAVVHKVFGASNVTKILNELSTSQREDAVNSLAYEAEARLRDPVYGCVGLISILQHRLKQLQADLENARKELAAYIGPQATLPILQPQAFMPQPPQHLGASSSSSSVMLAMMGVPRVPAQQQNKHLVLGQMAAAELAARDLILGFNSGFDSQGLVSNVSGFNQIGTGGISPSLSLSTIHNNNYHHHQLQPQLLLQPQEAQQLPDQQTQEQPSAKGEEGRIGGPSC